MVNKTHWIQFNTRFNGSMEQHLLMYSIHLCTLFNCSAPYCLDIHIFSYMFLPKCQNLLLIFHYLYSAVAWAQEKLVEKKPFSLPLHTSFYIPKPAPILLDSYYKICWSLWNMSWNIWEWIYRLTGTWIQGAWSLVEVGLSPPGWNKESMFLSWTSPGLHPGLFGSVSSELAPMSRRVLDPEKQESTHPVSFRILRFVNAACSRLNVPLSAHPKELAPFWGCRRLWGDWLSLDVVQVSWVPPDVLAQMLELHS